MTISWIYNADIGFGHNVNHWHEGKNKTEAQIAWDECNFANITDEQGEPFYTTAQNPDYIFQTENVEIGMHYFACGLGYNETGTEARFHCNRGVKATIQVVDDLQDCDVHHF